jgi:hypothetical protein
VYNELVNLFQENLLCFNFNANTTLSPDIIACIHTWIQQLAQQKILLKLDSKYKSSYKDHFSTDISHAKDLPKDIYHHIKIKPGLPVSVGWAYSCPRKYREGWKTLIQQHLVARWICPLSSQYASPLFIIPKADLNILP